jgi:hypothetical protein
MRRLKQAVLRLPRPEREIFIACSVHGFANEDAALRFGLSTLEVEQLLARPDEPRTAGAMTAAPVAARVRPVSRHGGCNREGREREPGERRVRKGRTGSHPEIIHDQDNPA